jgi:osmoprotectant transport system substrate-binding protein
VKPSWRRLLGLLLVMSALVLAASAAAGRIQTTTQAAAPTATTATTIRIGTKDFTEEFILGELYAQALKAKGFKVQLKSNVGSTEIIDKALTSNKIDMYPEYTGTSLTVVFGKSGSAKTARATWAQAKALYEKRGQTLLNMTPFSDSDAIAVLKETATKNKLSSLGDLKKVKGLKLGGQPEFRTRTQGLPGLKKNYGLASVTFVPFAGISPYEALDQKKVDAAAIFSTDPPLNSGKYTVLTDPKAQFGFQNVAPVVDKKLAASLGPKFRTTVNAVSAKLTRKAIIAMNSAVAIDQRTPKEVAAAFLKANGLA